MAEKFLDKKRSWITDDRKPGESLSIRDAGKAIKEGVDETVKLGKKHILGEEPNSLREATTYLNFETHRPRKR